jgi:hypothetical protein
LAWGSTKVDTRRGRGVFFGKNRIDWQGVRIEGGERRYTPRMGGMGNLEVEEEEQRNVVEEGVCAACRRARAKRAKGGGGVRC